MENNKNKFTINYVYFGILLLILSFLHIYHVCIIEKASFLEHVYFSGYAIFQCALEVGAFLLLGILICAYFPKFLFPIFVSVSFLLFFCHVLDFPLVRLMDTSIWFWISVVSNETPENFIEMLKASNISLLTWGLSGAATVLVIACGIFLYYRSEKWVNKRPFELSLKQLSLSLYGLSLFFVGWDLLLSPFVLESTDEGFNKILPWKATISSSSLKMHPFKSGQNFSQNDRKFLNQLPKNLELEKKPPIFLFVVESLREDFITEEIAPEVAAFRDNYISFHHAFSNANCTQNSWFSIFYSKLPFYWEKYQANRWSLGSIPLYLLKSMGYKIQLYSSSDFAYYQMHKVLFGQGGHLLASQQLHMHDDSKPAYKSDQELMEGLRAEVMQGDLEGKVFLIFLDSTHFGYSWPEENSPFTPYDKEINYIQAAYQKESFEGIASRYKNALHFVDGLFGQFITALQSTDFWKESVVIFTADHGEEFNEGGHLFHASDLSFVQTHVPLYYKLGNIEGKKEERLTSHIDLFPTLFDYLSGRSFKESLQGHSILQTEKPSFVISARYNASRAPYEFFIHNGKHRLHARFANENAVLKSKEIQILSIKDNNEKKIVSEEIEKTFLPALKDLLR